MLEIKMESVTSYIQVQVLQTGIGIGIDILYGDCQQRITTSHLQSLNTEKNTTHPDGNKWLDAGLGQAHKWLGFCLNYNTLYDLSMQAPVSLIKDELFYMNNIQRKFL